MILFSKLFIQLFGIFCYDIENAVAHVLDGPLKGVDTDLVRQIFNRGRLRSEIYSRADHAFNLSKVCLDAIDTAGA